MIINSNIITIGHQALEEDLCHTLMDIFDEQELELIRKEFTYVVQKKKLKDFKE